MNQKTRIIVGVLILVVAVAIPLAWEAWRSRTVVPATTDATEPTLTAGSIPVYVEGRLVAGFVPADLDKLTKTSFLDKEEGKSQEGWLLRDVLLLYVPQASLQPEVEVTISSSSRDKAATVTWAQVRDEQNWVLLALSNRGTLKLVSTLEQLDTRNEWVQDIDRIEVGKP